MLKKTTAKVLASNTRLRKTKADPEIHQFKSQMDTRKLQVTIFLLTLVVLTVCYFVCIKGDVSMMVQMLISVRWK